MAHATFCACPAAPSSTPSANPKLLIHPHDLHINRKARGPCVPLLSVGGEAEPHHTTHVIHTVILHVAHRSLDPPSPPRIPPERVPRTRTKFGWVATPLGIASALVVPPTSALTAADCRKSFKILALEYGFYWSLWRLGTVPESMADAAPDR